MEQEQAMAEVRQALRRHKTAERRLKETHQGLREALRAASAAGARQAELVKLTGYTREHVRRLLLPDKEE